MHELPEGQRIAPGHPGVLVYSDHIVSKLEYLGGVSVAGHEFCVEYTFGNGFKYAVVPVNERFSAMPTCLMNDGFSKQRNNFRLSILKHKGKYRCYAYSIRDIQANEECCIEYGPNFWAYYLSQNSKCPTDLKLKVRDYYFKKNDALLDAAIAQYGQ